jgi:adenine phosphoribosyltransferase
MADPRIERLQSAVRDVPDFPKPGILFKDITPILGDGQLFRDAVGCFLDAARPLSPQKIVGIDARGFLFGAVVAYELGVGFVPVRKKGKLPYRCQSAAYALEYGESVVEMHEDALQPGEKVILIDDLLATGGTAAAASHLITQMGARLLQILFLIELTSLRGAERLAPESSLAFLKY